MTTAIRASMLVALLASVTVDVARASTIQGRTVDRETGAGVATTVFLFGRSSANTAPPTHSYTFSNLPAGDYTVSANPPPGYTVAEYSICVNATGTCHTDNSFVPSPNLLAPVHLTSSGFVDVWWRFTLDTTHVYDFDDLPANQLLPETFPSSGMSGEAAQVTTAGPRSSPQAVQLTGNDAATNESYAYFTAYDVNLPITDVTQLEYWVMPLFGTTSFAVDLQLDDGSFLRDSGCVDQFGVRVHPAAQGTGGNLGLNTYQRVASGIGKCLAGRTIQKIIVAFDRPPSTGFVNAEFDDVKISEAPTIPLAPSGTVWVQGLRVDETNLPFGAVGTTLTPAGGGATCGADYGSQYATSCAPALTQYVAKVPIDSAGQATISSTIPSGRTVLASVCADGTGYPGQYECLGHAKYCRALLVNGVATVKLPMLPNRVPRYADVWWRYIPTASSANFPVCDAAGFPRTVSTSSLPSGSHGDVDADGYLTIADGVRALRCANGFAIGTPGACTPNADFDQSGTVTVSDASQIFRLAAGKSVPEPYTVKPVYFIPQDEEFDTCYKAKLQNALTMIQQFYGQTMQGLGYGYRPFNMELDPDGRPHIYFIRGRQPLSNYLPIESTDAIINGEMTEIFDMDKSLLAIENEINGFKGFIRGFPNHGSTAYVQDLIDYTATTVAGQDALFCDATPDPDGTARGARASAIMGGLAHEMGHAFGSYHENDDIQPGFHQLMGLGNYTFARYFVSCPVPGDRSTTFGQNLGLLLNNSAFFRTPTSYADKTQPSVTLTVPASVASGQPIPMTVTFNDVSSGPRVLYVIVDQSAGGGAFLNAEVDALTGPGTRSFTYTPPQALPAGSHQVTAFVFDDASNPNSDTKFVNITQ